MNASIFAICELILIFVILLPCNLDEIFKDDAGLKANNHKALKAIDIRILQSWKNTKIT